MDDKNVTLNGERLTEEEFKKRAEDLEKKPGVKVVETGEGQFRTRLED
jgi:hypothetical protein